MEASGKQKANGSVDPNFGNPNTQSADSGQQMSGSAEFFEVCQGYMKNTARKRKLHGKSLFSKHLSVYVSKKGQKWTTQQSHDGWTNLTEDQKDFYNKHAEQINQYIASKAKADETEDEPEDP